MARKIKYGIFIMGLLLCCLFAGYYFGYCQGKGIVPGEALRQDAGEEDTKITYNKTIAIVNLDEGTKQQGEQENYGIRLIDTITDDVVITGLEDARRGIESGTYSAYMVIPAAFSEQVCTIAAQPVKSEIIYALGSGLTGEEREETIYRMESIFQLFNNNLSKVYLSSVLAEYHEAQDSASSIIYNDTEDMELLLQIRGEDLMEYIETPQMTVVERDISQLELADHYAENSQLIEQINTSYRGFNEKGTEAVELIKTEFGQTEEMIGRLQGEMASMEEIVKALDSTPWDDSEQAAEEDAFYQARKEALTSMEMIDEGEGEGGGTGDDGEEGGKEEGGTGSDGEEGVAGDSGEEENREKEGGTDNVDTGDKGEEGGTDDGGEEGDNGEEGGTDDGGEEGDNGEEGGDETEGDDSKKERPKGILTAYNASLQEKQEELLLDFLAGLREETTLPEEDEQETYVKDFLEEQEAFLPIDIGLVDQEIDALIQAAKDSRTVRNEALEKEGESWGLVKEQIKEQMGTIGTSCDEVHTAYEATKEAMTSFDLTSFIDEEEINGYLRQMQDNLRDVERKVGDQTADYEEYVSDVYEATDNDIRSFEEEIVRGQEQSEKKLVQGLEGVKNSRQENNENNLRLLNGLITQMPYTRIGEVENREVYDFIAEPIITSNLSESEKEIREREGIRPETVVFLMAFGGVILLLGGIQIVAQRKKMTEEWG